MSVICSLSEDEKYNKISDLRIQLVNCGYINEARVFTDTVSVDTRIVFDIGGIVLQRNIRQVVNVYIDCVYSDQYN